MRAPDANAPLLPVRRNQGLSRVGAKRQRGQALVYSLFAALLIILGLYSMYGMNSQVVEKIKLQNTADAAAYSAAIVEARDYNFSAYTNRAMVANQVAVAQFVGLTSWLRNMAALNNESNAAKYPGGDSTIGFNDTFWLYVDAGDGIVKDLYVPFLEGVSSALSIFYDGGPGSVAMSAIVTLLDSLINVYDVMQSLYHYTTALTVVQTVGGISSLGQTLSDMTGITAFDTVFSTLNGKSILTANDPDANTSLTPGGTAYLVYHMYKWFNFTESKDPNVAGKDGTEADRFAGVTINSLDNFSRDRSTYPAWGVSLFYAPFPLGLTLFDPSVLIPEVDGPLFTPVIHRGGTELKLTTSTGGNTSGDPGATQKDCHGQPLNASGANVQIAVKTWDLLSSYTAGACAGTIGMVQVDDGNGHPAGSYTYNGTAWIDSSKVAPPQPATPTNAATGSGNTGAADMKAKKTWTAMDASSWADLSIMWLPVLLGIPLPFPIPFMPPFVPLSHGAAQSGTKLDPTTVLNTNNNFGVTSDEAYGKTVSNWTTALAGGEAKNGGAGGSLDLFPALGGLHSYMDVTDTDGGSTEGPPLVIEVQKPISSMAKPPGVGRLELTNGAPAQKIDSSQYMRALSKASVYFSRPNGDSGLAWFDRSDKKTELGSLYNPYWQARLAPNSFIEQYLSTELHSLGI